MRCCVSSIFLKLLLGNLEETGDCTITIDDNQPSKPITGSPGTSVIVLDDEDGCPKSKKPKLEEHPLGSKDESRITDKSKKHSGSSPLFYLTKVNGIRDVFNGSHIAIGIKGAFTLRIYTWAKPLIHNHTASCSTDRTL